MCIVQVLTRITITCTYSCESNQWHEITRKIQLNVQIHKCVLRNVDHDIRNEKYMKKERKETKKVPTFTLLAPSRD
jgi:ribosomal protein S6